MIEKLNDYRDRWIDKEVTLVGSGPTGADYADLPDQPTICINDVVYLVNCPDRYFFSLHPQKYEDASDIGTWLKWAGERNPAQPSRCVEINFSWEKGPRIHWQLDQDYCARHNRLAVRYGSISAAIHFIWFTGARNILGVGINPATAALGHDSRIGGGTPTRQMQFIANRMVEDLAFFGLSVRYA